MRIDDESNCASLAGVIHIVLESYCTVHPETKIGETIGALETVKFQLLNRTTLMAEAERLGIPEGA